MAVQLRPLLDISVYESRRKCSITAHSRVDSDYVESGRKSAYASARSDGIYAGRVESKRFVVSSHLRSRTAVVPT